MENSKQPPTEAEKFRQQVNNLVDAIKRQKDYVKRVKRELDKNPPTEQRAVLTAHLNTEAIQLQKMKRRLKSMKLELSFLMVSEGVPDGSVPEK